MSTPNLQLPEVPSAIQDAPPAINDGFERLDAIVQLAVIDKDLQIAPAAPIQGDRYIVAGNALGPDWGGRDRAIAWYGPNGWKYYPPRPGWRAYVLDEAVEYLYNGVAWVEFASGGGGGSIEISDGSTTVSEVSSVTFDGATVTDLGGGAVDVQVPTLLVTPASAARVYKNATQSIADSTLTALTWPVEDYDSDALHSTSVNTSRFTVAVAGKYDVGASIKWDANTSGSRAVYIVVNGVTGTRRAAVLNAASNGLVQCVSTVLDLAATDYVEIYAFQDSGGARDVTNSEQISSAYIAKVGNSSAPTQMRGATWVRSDGEITVPVNDVYHRMPINAVIVGATIMTIGGPGTCSIDVRRDAFGSFPPNAGDSICGGNKPSISTGMTFSDTTLTGWSTSVSAGDVIALTLESSSNFRAVFFQLHFKESF